MEICNNLHFLTCNKFIVRISLIIKYDINRRVKHCKSSYNTNKVGALIKCFESFERQSRNMCKIIFIVNRNVTIIKINLSI